MEQVIEDAAAVVAFDMTRSIKWQTEVARRLLNQRQKSLVAEERIEVDRVKNHQSTWARYLRALDAEGSGAKPSKIGEHLTGAKGDWSYTLSSAGNHLLKSARDTVAKHLDPLFLK